MEASVPKPPSGEWQEFKFRWSGPRIASKCKPRCLTIVPESATFLSISNVRKAEVLMTFFEDEWCRYVNRPRAPTAMHEPQILTACRSTARITAALRALEEIPRKEAKKPWLEISKIKTPLVATALHMILCAIDNCGENYFWPVTNSFGFGPRRVGNCPKCESAICWDGRALTKDLRKVPVAHKPLACDDESNSESGYYKDTSSEGEDEAKNNDLDHAPMVVSS